MKHISVLHDDDNGGHNPDNATLVVFTVDEVAGIADQLRSLAYRIDDHGAYKTARDIADRLDDAAARRSVSD